MAHPDPFDDAELRQRLADHDREWNTYVANQRIFFGTALAYDVGHAVPVSNVVRHGYWLKGQVDLVVGREHAPEVEGKPGTIATPAAETAEEMRARHERELASLPPIDPVAEPDEHPRAEESEGGVE